MKKRILIFSQLVFAICYTSPGYALPVHIPSLTDVGIKLKADIPVSGTVRSEDGAPMPGVSVLIKGTTNGTTTDKDGKYQISVPEGATLIFSFVGYLSLERTTDKLSIIDIQLEPDIQTLEQVVVVGYGTQQKKDLVGSVAVAGRKEFGDVNVSTVNQLIQGKIAGVQVVNNSGVPGSGTNIVIRGTGSFSSVAPLYVIDGIQSDAGTFNSLSPYDIESITVLKDASSVAIYGAQGANGVVQVTTKRAKSGALRIAYDGYYGISQAWKKLDLLNASQYIDLVKDIAAVQNTKIPDKLNTPDVLVDRTDWQDVIFQTAKLQEHHLSLSGGTDKVLYTIAAGYTNQESIEVGYNFKRLNLLINLEENIGKHIRLGQSLNMRYTLRTGTTPDFTAALRMPPYAPVYDPTNLGGYSRVTTINDLNDSFNPLTNVFLRDKKDRSWLNYAQFFGEIDILNGLKFRSQASLNIGYGSGYDFIQANKNGNLTNPDGIIEGYGWSLFPLLENILSYNKHWGKHMVSATLGNSYRDPGAARSVSLSGSGFNNYDITQIGVVSKANLNPAGGTAAGAATSALISYFGRVNYSFRDRYLLSFTLRRDGVSVFGPSKRFGNFPSVGLGWKVNEEPFMSGLTSVSSLKLRASWGKTGNASIPPFSYEPLVFKGVANNIVYSLGPDKIYVRGATIGAASNPNLGWEETTQTDVGIDLGLWEDRLNLTVDYYNRQNDGLLVNVNIPPSTGVGGTGYIPTAILTNAASAYNRGLEVSATYNGQVGPLQFSISANGAYNKNQVTTLGTQNAVPITGGGYAGVSAMTRTEPGHPIGAFYGYKTDHVAISQADVDAYNKLAQERSGGKSTVYQANLKPGDIIFQDLNNDGVVNEKDQTFLGSPIPKWNYGANVNLSYHSFDLMVSLQGIGGVQTVNALRYWTEGTTRPFNSSTAVLDRWRKEGDITSIPRAGQNANSNLNLRPSDRFVEDGSYLRVRNVTLGYGVPSAVLHRWMGNAVSSIRMYVTAQNLFTITKYSGYDPEVSGQSFLFARGIDQGQYPQPRTFLVGLQLGF
ncbi:SusC/RagA family TonB-linked outer membrane protein [Xanthocytophaga flava]|uniref:SusC/RagA family TonB-linked outer membrane protein n=1 Tax=Xanthocytophaga flava TaxID=3048013 RepID=UPI0028D642D5|nr:TonB-dependent receptor [Xanthocytophaga flavus]MDJ1473334.1 TonB-dependent receptor [Xanthocytophaga flavus]